MLDWRGERTAMILNKSIIGISTVAILKEMSHCIFSNN